MKKLGWLLAFGVVAVVALAVNDEAYARGSFVIIDAHGFGGQSGNIVQTYVGRVK